jgi:large subunit ribosomal protein L29
MIKQDDIKELSTGELKARLAEERTLLIKLRMSHAVSPVENPIKIRSVRKGIARMETELTKRNNK